MPVFLNSEPLAGHGSPFARRVERSNGEITIGLVNNMSDGALAATERQFISLLDAASDGLSVHLTLYTLPEIARNDLAARHVRECYSSFEKLLDTKVDGLIVTGREPLTNRLEDEVYWESFTKLVDWAHENTLSTIWSCLAAHAAVLHMHGIGRVRSDKKHSGVFNCERLGIHPLTAGMPSRFEVPHSRWNGILEDQLIAHGYRALTRTTQADIDTFIKRTTSMFVFFQGHPEYESNTLMLEYRRDLGRYLRGEASSWPAMPWNYFDHETSATLSSFQEQATFRPCEEVMADVSTLLKSVRIDNTWQATSTCIYRNWLEYICAQKHIEWQDCATDPLSRGNGSATQLVADLKDASSSHPLPALTAS